MTDQLFNCDLSITATAHATHPEGVLLDEHGNPVLDAAGQPIYEEKE